MQVKRVGIVFLALALALPVFSLANTEAKGNSADAKAGCEKCGDHAGKRMKCGAHMCPMMIQGAEVKVENIAEGTIVTITSKDKEVAAKIQEKAKACQACKMTKAEGKDQDGTVVCPVMGSKIQKSQAVAVREYKGEKYYLCCKECIAEFDKNPEKYAKK